MNILIQETYVNATEHHQIGETDVYETFTSNKRDLFRSLQREHGRCKGYVYVDRDDSAKPPRKVGWIFEKRRAYTDAPRETYLAETWVTLHKRPPRKTVKYFYR